MLHYVRRGGGRPLVLLHGFMGGSGYWARQLESWAGQFDVIAPDLPGFAGSAMLDPCRSIESMARSVLHFLDELRIGRILLLGHSMGGMVAQQMALDEPDRICKVVLYGTSPTGALPGRFEPIDASIERLRRDGVAATARMIVGTWFRDGCKHERHDLCVRAGEGASLEAAVAALQALSSWDVRPMLAQVQVPALVISGDQDRSCPPEQAYRLWRSLRNGSLCIIPGSAHAAHLEQPEIFDLAVMGFLLRDASSTRCTLALPASNLRAS
ncbi:MAG: alpha/beta fold hydrolase [Lautropia sp.]